MPMLIPLAAAAGSIAAGVAAGAATLIGGAMIAGGALTAIGVVTKNQKLVKIGGLVSLAGGIAGLASGAWASAASSMAEQSSMQAAQEAFRSGGAGFAGELSQTAATNAAMTGAEAAGGAAEVASQAVPAAQQAAPEISRQALQTGIIQQQPAAPANVVDVGSASAAPGGVKPPSTVNSLGDTVNQVGGWMNRNKELVKVGSEFIGGAMKNASDQDMLAERLRQEEEYIKRRRAQLSAGIIGLKMPTYQPPKV